MAEGAINGSGIDLEKELTCSICTDLLFQPLTLLDCLHTFCGSCLKEWFSWQATSASHSRRTAQPYTCPSCRAQVRAARPNANVTTLLEMFVQANPGRGKSEVEKEEARQNYHPGDDVMPPVHVRPESDDSEDERLLDEVRQLSVADLDPAVAANRRAGRATRTGQGGRDMSRTRTERERQRSSVDQARRRQEAVERNVEHQPSLRSLLGASGEDSADVQADILQSILSSGLLDGVDLDNLTAEQEEELTERIADAYRRRQRHRDRSRNRERRDRSSQPNNPNQETRQRQQGIASSEATPHGQTRSRPPASGPRLLEQWTQDSSSAGRRAASATGHRRATSSSASNPSYLAIGTQPAARSATDLSERPTTQDAARERRRRMSAGTRSNTDPVRPADFASDRQVPAGASNDRTRDGVHGGGRAVSNDVVSRVPPHPANDPNSSPGTQNSNSVTRATVDASTQDRIPSSQPQSPASVGPKVRCVRCDKPDLQHNLHYNCSKCYNGNFNLCLSCYRAGAGCNHWFGFGYMAQIRWERAAPVGGWPAGYERPHVLLPRRYNNSQDSQRTTPKLQEGAFCERCFKLADSCYWHCSVCFEGAWGFCNSCVNQGRHCTHPLTATAHMNTLRQSRQDTIKTITLPHLKENAYALAPISTVCAVSRYPIPLTEPRFHCYQCNNGEYDMSNDAYHSLMAAGKIGAADGPSGRRRCLHNHPMAVVAFQETTDGIQQRITVAEPTGGSIAAKADTSSQPSGLRCLALWSWFPAEGIDDELAFPKFAEIREVERVNEDYFLGVYARDHGLFPANHVRVI